MGEGEASSIAGRAMIQPDEQPELRGDVRRPPLGRAGALQHRRRRLRQAPPRQARDGVGELRRLGARARLGRAAGPGEPGGPHARRAGRDAWRPRRRCPAADAGDGGDLLRRLEARRDPALDVGALRRRRDRASALGLAGAAARHRRRERASLRPAVGAGHARDRRGDPGRRADGLHLRGHGGGRSCPALLHVGHDRAREGDRARAPLHPRPRGVHLLPRGRGRRELPRHGRVGVGRRDRAAARPVAARRGAVRLPARGRVRPEPAARRSSAGTASRTSSRRRRRCGR